jgi:2-dehydro-3-deoxygalactonokinase
VIAASGSPHGITPLLFSTRAAVLTGVLAAESSLEYLSGLLIGDEIRCGLAGGGRPSALIGDRALCDRYLTAFALFDLEAVPVIGDSAPAGLWQIAQHASLVGPTTARGLA